MSYYMGDFYGGPSFYRGPGRGDPGFFSFMGGLFKKVFRPAVGLIPGVGGLLQSIIPSGAGRAAERGLAELPLGAERLSKMQQIAGGARSAMKRIGEFAAQHPTLSAAGGAGAGALLAGAELHKHRRMLEHAVGMGGRRHRRMNVCNPRALRRAIRRTHGFAKLAMRTIHLVHPKKKARFGGFRRRKRKS